MSLIIIIILWSIFDLHLMRIYYLRNKKAIEYIKAYYCNREDINDCWHPGVEVILEILKGKTSEN